MSQITAGKFNKRALKGHASNPCQRKLYLALGNARQGWTEQPNGAIVEIEDISLAQTHTITSYGSFYEDVYLQHLMEAAPQHIVNCTPRYIDAEAWPTPEHRTAQEIEHWHHISQQAQEHGFVFAFEQQWIPETSFVDHIIGCAHQGIVEKSRGDRPDVMLVDWVQEHPIEAFRFDPLHSVIHIEKQVFTGLTIRILDIKNTQFERCDKHFPDIIYYITSLLHHLHKVEQALGMPIRICSTGNAILGRMSFDDFTQLNPMQLRQVIQQSTKHPTFAFAPVEWELHATILKGFTAAAQKVIHQRQHFKAVQPTISNACVQCPYTHSCLNSTLDPLGHTPERLPHVDDTIALLPSILPRIQAVLKRNSIHTIRQLLDNITQLHTRCSLNPIPDELNRPLRSLHLKALAFQENQITNQHHPQYTALWQPGTRTIHLPPKPGLFLFLCIESDPAQNRIHTVSMQLDDSLDKRHNVLSFSQTNTGLEHCTEKRLLQDVIGELHAALQYAEDTEQELQFLFWGSGQWARLCEALDRHPDLIHENDAADLLFQLFPPPSCGIPDPNIQRRVFNIERAIDILFSQPEAFKTTWISTHHHMQLGDLLLQPLVWGKRRDLFDFSIWNLYAGELQHTHIESSSAHQFTHLPAHEVVHPNLYETFKRLSILPHANRQWVGNHRLKRFIEDEIGKKARALSQITHYCYTHAAEFISQEPLAITPNKTFDMVQTEAVKSPISQLFLRYQRWNSWVAFQNYRHLLHFPHEAVAKMSAAWVTITDFQETSRWEKYHIFLSAQGPSVHSACYAKHGNSSCLLKRLDFSAAPMEKLVNEQTKDGPYLASRYNYYKPDYGDYYEPSHEYFMVEPYKDLWRPHLEKLVAAHLNQSDLSFHFPIDSHPHLEQQPQNNRAPSNVELYLFAAQQLPSSSFSGPLRSQLFPKPTTDQTQAITTALSNTISLIQGPPGTGKSSTIVSLIEEWLHTRKDGDSARILITAANYAAMSVVIEKIQTAKTSDGSRAKVSTLPIHLLNFQGREESEAIKDDAIFIKYQRKKYRSTRWTGEKLETAQTDPFPKRAIIAANSFSLSTLLQKSQELPNGIPFFDLIVVDEASQLPADHLIPALACTKPIAATANQRQVSIHTPAAQFTRVVVIGDGDQLAAVRQVEAPKTYRELLSSIYSFYSLQLDCVQLYSNFRSIEPIVAAIRALHIYHRPLQRARPLHIDPTPKWCADLTLPWETESTSISMLVHSNPQDAIFSELEADLSATAAKTAFVAYYEEHKAQWDWMLFLRFFERELGIVTPHNVHRQKMITKLKSQLSPWFATDPNHRQQQLQSIGNAVRTVDKFQGSARSFIIGTIGISLPSRLEEEESFLYQRNRFNVMISRPKDRLLLICSDNFLQHVPKSEGAAQLLQGIRRIQNTLLPYQQQINWDGELLSLHYDKM